MSSSVETLSSSGEGLLTSALAQFSLSPRQSLLEAIRKNNWKTIEENLIASAAKYSAFELIAAMYVLVQRPEHSKIAVAHAIQLLASRLITNSAISKESWEKLIALMQSGATHKRIYNFIDEDSGYSNDALDDECREELIEKLSTLFAPHIEGTLDPLVENAAPLFLANYSFSLDDALSSLELAYEFSSGASEEGLFDFMVEAISFCEHEERRDELFFKLLQGDTSSVKELSAQAFQALKRLPLHRFHRTICQDILDNPIDLPFIKLELIQRALQPLHEVAVSTLFELIPRLTLLSTDVAVEFFLELLLTKEWKFDLLTFDDTLSHCTQTLDKLIHGDLTTIAPDKRGKDLIIEKLLRSAVLALEEFAETQRATLKALPEEKREYRETSCYEMKLHAIWVLFFLHASISNSKKRNELFAYLTEKLIHLQVTTNPCEEMVKKVGQSLTFFEIKITICDDF